MPRAHIKADGPKVARLRGEAGLTQADLAAQAGFGLRTIGKLECGQPTTALTLSAVATVLSRKLQRTVALGDILREPAEPGQVAAGPEAGLLVAEQLKVLDLRRWRSGLEHPVELIDHHRFRRCPQGEGNHLPLRDNRDGAAWQVPVAPGSLRVVSGAAEGSLSPGEGVLRSAFAVARRRWVRELGHPKHGRIPGPLYRQETRVVPCGDQPPNREPDNAADVSGREALSETARPVPAAPGRTVPGSGSTTGGSARRPAGLVAR